jgi:citrate synthase
LTAESQGSTIDPMTTPTVDSLTTHPAVVVAPSETLEIAIQRMHDHRVGSVVVVDAAKVVGIVANIGDPALVADVPRGLKGVVVSETEVGDVRGREGFYHYRQYSAIDLAQARPLEDVWRLLIDGSLPSSLGERRAFVEEVNALRSLPEQLQRVLPILANSIGPLDGLRTALSLVGAADRMRPVLDLTHAERRDNVLRLSAVTPVILCALHRISLGYDAVDPRSDLSYAENYLWMMNGTEGKAEHVRAIEQYLISTIDHGFNASTFTARVIASTGADCAAAIVGAVGSLSGPLHGGAPSRALELLDEIGTSDRIDVVVRPKIEQGERIMGFGHPVYRTDDPRSLMLRDIAVSLGGPLADLGVLVERRVVELLAELKPGRELYTNVEFFAGVVMATCGLPPSMFTPTFASSRVIGWSANVLEQAADSKIIRPSARYVGPPPPVAIPTIG